MTAKLKMGHKGFLKAVLNLGEPCRDVHQLPAHSLQPALPGVKKQSLSLQWHDYGDCITAFTIFPPLKGVEIVLPWFGHHKTPNQKFSNLDWSILSQCYLALNNYAKNNCILVITFSFTILFDIIPK